MAALGGTSWLAPAALAPLLMRAIAGLSQGRTPVRPQLVGMQELGYGMLTVDLVVLDQRL